MSKPATTANSFGTFLESLEATRAPARSGDGPLAVLEAIQRSSTGEVRELMGELGIDLVQFARTIASMQEAGLIELVGTGASQVARLTTMGTALLKMATR